jgi:excisionase family DNA binding protein
VKGGALEGEERLLMRGYTTPLVKGPCVEGVTGGIPLDSFLSLRALAAYAGLSVRKLRDCLNDPKHPLPHYRVGGKILVRRSEFDAWMDTYHQVGSVAVDQIVENVLGRLP